MALAIKNDRNGSRRKVDFDVTLVARHGIPFHGTLENISFSGGYIATANRALLPSTPITVVLQQDEGEFQKIYRMNGTVVRQDQQGAAIMFNDYDADTVRSLRTIFKSTLDQ